jgi:hypothetical protein
MMDIDTEYLKLQCWEENVKMYFVGRFHPFYRPTKALRESRGITLFYF